MKAKDPLHRKMHTHMKQNTISPWSQALWFSEVHPCTPDWELCSNLKIIFYRRVKFNLKFMNSKRLWTLINYLSPLLISRRENWMDSISQAMCEYWFQPCHIAFLHAEWRDYSAHISRWGSPIPVINTVQKPRHMGSGCLKLHPRLFLYLSKRLVT